jgi:hypothetical protein
MQPQPKVAQPSPPMNASAPSFEPGQPLGGVPAAPKPDESAPRQRGLRGLQNKTLSKPPAKPGEESAAPAAAVPKKEEKKEEKPTPKAAAAVPQSGPRSPAEPTATAKDDEGLQMKAKKKNKLLLAKKENVEFTHDPFSDSKPEPAQVEKPQEVKQAKVEDDEVDDWEEVTDAKIEQKAAVSLRPTGSLGGSKAGKEGTKDAVYQRDLLTKYRTEFASPFPELRTLKVLPQTELTRSAGQKKGGAAAQAPLAKGGSRPPDRSTWGQTPSYPASGSKAPKILELRGKDRLRQQKDVKLHKSENAYKIGAGKHDEENSLRRQVKSLLNKITAENFTSITDKLANLELTQAIDLDIVIDLVFDKAVNEHNYCEMYADMCLVLRTRFPEFQAPEGDEEGAPTLTFTRALLNRCQEEFENLPQTLGPAAMTEEQQKLTPEEQEVIIKKMKDRVLGNMKFIGQLYLRKLLSHKVVREVVLRLVFKNEPPEEHYIECFCMLVRNIGATLESSEQGRSYMQQFASRMKDLSNIDQYSKRIKFAIQNVLDLRSNHWEERVLKERMKTKDQIRRDAMREQRAQQSGAQNFFAQTEIAGQRPSYITAVMQKQEQEAARAKKELEKIQKEKKDEDASSKVDQLRKAIAYFLSDLDEEAIISEWSKISPSESEAGKALREIIEQGFSNPKKASDIVKLITATLRGEAVPWRVLEAELAKQLPMLPDLQLDNPKAQDFYQDLVTSFLTGNLPVTSFEGAFKPITALEEPEMGFEVLVGVLERVKILKGLPGLKSALTGMKGSLMSLKNLENKEALHAVLMERGLYRDVQEVISKIESRFADKDFSEEGFEKSLQETYGAKKPTELQSDEFLMRFIEVWIKQAKDFEDSWQERTAASANLFSNPLLSLVQQDASPSMNAQKRQCIVLEAVAHGCVTANLDDQETMYLLQAMYDMGMLAETVLYKWSSDTSTTDNPEKMRIANAIRKIAEDGE